MKVLKFLVRAFFLLAVTAAFFGGPFCDLALRPLDFVWGAAVTLLLGRFFCDAVCPLGIVQTLVNRICHPKAHVRRVCSRLPETKAQRLVRWSVAAACIALGASGCMGLATMVFPLSVYGKALTLWTPGLAVFGLVVVLAAIGQGRFWCNWVCPFGTVYNLLAKVSPCKNRVGTGCDRCGRCFGKGKVRGQRSEVRGQRSEVGGPGRDIGDQGSEVESRREEEGGVTRRETLKGVAILAVADKINDGGLSPVSLPGVPERGTDVLPPGAGSRRAFSLKCVGCQLCVAKCPGECLAPSVRLSSFGQPTMDFRRGYCLSECARCSEVCPTGAIRFLQREQRPYVHVGHAVWKRDLCIRTTEGETCTACVRKCPVRAIHLVKGFPVVDRETCIGCGACEHVCPARPMPAIFVKGYEMQRIVNPISEADLLAEMRARLDAGASVVAARNGVIVAVGEGRGLDPLAKLCEEGKLEGAVVMDKVTGRAAAALCVAGGAKKVFAKLAGKGAAELFAKRGIPFKADKTVDVILNREQSGSCPMERAVDGKEDPDEMVKILRRALAK